MSELSGIRLRPRAPGDERRPDPVLGHQGAGVPVAAAALVVGGVLVVLFPQHTVTVLRLVLATMAVAVLALVLRPVRQRPEELSSLLEQDGRWRARRSDAVPGLAAIHGALLEKSAPAPGVPLSSGVRHRLFTIVATTLDQEGIDVTDPAQAPAVAARVSPLTRSVIADELRPTRGDGWRQRITPAASAEIVHAVLDDLQPKIAVPPPAPGNDLQPHVAVPPPAPGTGEA